MAEQIIVTNKCSMTCSHCPYSKNQMANEPLKTIDYSNLSEIVVLTGGEVFEDISLLHKTVESIEEKGILYRIATSGHVSMTKYYHYLLQLKGLLGINFSTDVLLRTTNSSLKEVWWKNWKVFEFLKISWITITLGNDVESKEICKLLHDAKPKIVMLNEIDSGYSEFENFAKELSDMFKETQFLWGTGDEIN